MRKIGSFIASLLMASAWALPAHADTIQFNPLGTGAPGITIDLMDPLPGNAITTFTSPVDPTTGQFTATILFQANLGTTSLNGLPNYTDCQPTCFTFTAAINVVGTVTGANTFDLALDPSSTSTFYMYAGAFGDNLSGQCFASADPSSTCGGTQIATGNFTTFVANFQQNADNTTCTVGGNVLTPCPLDAHPPTAVGNNYPGVTTIVGGGSIISADIQITDFLAGYFPDLTKNTSFFIATSKESTPYTSTDPSAFFSSDGKINADALGVGAVGAINGNSTASTMTETDSSVTFVRPTAAVPEPASLLLLGTGLMGAAAARRRRASKRN